MEDGMGEGWPHGRRLRSRDVVVEEVVVEAWLGETVGGLAAWERRLVDS